MEKINIGCIRINIFLVDKNKYFQTHIQIKTSFVLKKKIFVEAATSKDFMCLDHTDAILLVNREGS